MDNQESFKKILYMKGFVLTEEQQKEFNEVIRSVSVFCNDVMEVFRQVFKEIVKPVLEEIYEVVKQEPKIGIKYGLVKVIRPTQYIKSNKPKIIRCRNNC